MIPLVLEAHAEADAPFVVRIGLRDSEYTGTDARLVQRGQLSSLFTGTAGLFEVCVPDDVDIGGDVLLVDPLGCRAERLLRHGSEHNTLLVTERCDQLCVMCSQPPKKSHEDRFALFTEACLLADGEQVIGISGGEPTLYKAQLLDMIETVLSARDDLQFHILTNGQHFAETDVDRLRNPIYRRVEWGIPLYAADSDLHDSIVAKTGAFARLEESMCHLLLAGAHIELRTVVLSSNIDALPRLADHIAARLPIIDAWSIMQLENIGFARNRWRTLYFDHRDRFAPIGAAIDRATLSGLSPRLFNFPICTVPEAYRRFTSASISDWKRKYAPGCEPCTARQSCTGFFEWHPTDTTMEVRPL